MELHLTAQGYGPGGVSIKPWYRHQQVLCQVVWMVYTGGPASDYSVCEYYYYDQAKLNRIRIDRRLPEVARPFSDLGEYASRTAQRGFTGPLLEQAYTTNLLSADRPFGHAYSLSVGEESNFLFNRVSAVVAPTVEWAEMQLGDGTALPLLLASDYQGPAEAGSVGVGFYPKIKTLLGVRVFVRGKAKFYKYDESTWGSSKHWTHVPVMQRIANKLRELR